MSWPETDHRAALSVPLRFLVMLTSELSPTRHLSGLTNPHIRILSVCSASQGSLSHLQYALTLGKHLSFGSHLLACWVTIYPSTMALEMMPFRQGAARKTVPWKQQSLLNSSYFSHSNTYLGDRDYCYNSAFTPLGIVLGASGIQRLTGILSALKGCIISLGSRDLYTSTYE